MEGLGKEISEYDSPQEEIDHLRNERNEWCRRAKKLQAENKLLKSQLDEFVYCEENPNYVSDGDKLTKCRAESERLQKLVREAYNEGMSDVGEDGPDGTWETSVSRASL